MSKNLFEDYQPPSVGASTGKNLKALIKYSPQLADLNQRLSEQYGPQQEALNLRLFSEYMPKYLESGGQAQREEDRRAALGAVQNEFATIQGGGLQLVEQANQLEALANPEWAKNKQLVGEGYASLIGGMDPNKLSGAELANTERGINRLNARTGNLNTADATSTTANAMQFGGALDAKRQNFGQALNLFPGISSSVRSQNDPYSIATGRGAQSRVTNQGQGAMTYNPGTMSQMTSGLQGTISGIQAQNYDINSQRRNAGDIFDRAMNTGANVYRSATSCCFIMLAASESFQLPKHILWCRDFYYTKYPDVAIGYKKMSKWLVPLMQESFLLRKFIKYSLFYPLDLYGKYLTGSSKFGILMKPVKTVWFTIWKNYAKK